MIITENPLIVSIAHRKEDAGEFFNQEFFMLKSRFTLYQCGHFYFNDLKKQCIFWTVAPVWTIEPNWIEKAIASGGVHFKHIALHGKTPEKIVIDSCYVKITDYKYSHLEQRIDFNKTLTIKKGMEIEMPGFKISCGQDKQLVS